MRGRHPSLLACCLLSLLVLPYGCICRPWIPSQAQVEQAQQVHGDVRIERNAWPEAYRVELEVDPRKDRFRGNVEIDLVLGQATDVIQLHGQDLNITEASLKVGDAKPIKAHAVEGINGSLNILMPKEVAAGRATLAVAYTAPLKEIPEGLYRVESDGAWYAFTQFEPMDARRVLPCFDQPEFKVPFDVSLRVPVGMLGVTNTPQKARELDGEWERFHFETSKPMPTYLVAFAIGNLDVVAAPADAIGEAPLRLLATHGKGKWAQWTLDHIPKIMNTLAAYFGQPYPYAKLDVAAVPNFAPGAMENVGLVTYRERLILLAPERMTAGDERANLSVNAHELAHMWFGNLVTLSWWDDLWLNEAFATWMATRVMTEAFPGYEAELQQIGGTQWVMGLDAKKNVRAVRQPIRHRGDIHNAFDGITYVKGRAIITMLEHWIGATDFQTGVRDYLNAHAHGVATTKELIDALENASHKPVEEVLSSFVDQPGVPLVDFNLECVPEGEAGHGKIRLAQTRYHALGYPASESQTWRIPVCFRYAMGERSATQCVMLDEATTVVDFPEPGCPEWIHPNAEEKGYYRWRLPAADLLALAQQHLVGLTTAERSALPGHLVALLEAGKLELPSFMQALEAIAKDPHPMVINGLLSAMKLLHTQILNEDRQAAFATWSNAILLPHLTRIEAMEPKERSAQTQILLPAIQRALARWGRHAPLIERAKTLTESYLKDPTSVTPDDASFALPSRARDGDESLWNGMRQALSSAPTPQLRAVVRNALASFNISELLEKSLNLLLDGTLKAQDARYIFRGAGRKASARQATWTWAQTHFETLKALLGESFLIHAPRFGSGFCSLQSRQSLVDFFGDKAHRIDGTERNLALTLESIDRCIRLRETFSESLDRYLTQERREE